MEKQNIFGYCRISTKNQNEDRQVEAMRQYNIEEENIFIDKKSGATFEGREEYQLLKKILKRTQHNVLVIKSIDRLRSQL